MNRFFPATAIVSLALATLAACGGSGAGASAKSAAAKAEPVKQIPVRVASVETRNVSRSIDVTGSLAPDDTVNIVSEVPGRIASIKVDFGQSVRKGDVIAEIDRQEYQLQLDRARAALSQALARVGLNADQEGVTPTTTPLVRQARAQLEDAKSKYESAKKLVESGDIARERFTEMEKLVNARTAALDAAMDDMRTAIANVQTIRADKRLIDKRLADTTIRAPFDGQISQRTAAPGQYVKDANTIVTLVKSWPLRRRADIPEVGAAAVRVGETLTFTTEAIPGRTFTATVTQLNPSLEARARSLSAEARLNQSDPLLRPGMFVQVKIVMSKAMPITVVPTQAVYTIAGLSKLFTVEGGVVREIRFTPGQTGDDWIEVPDGSIQPGQTIAVTQLPVLSDGAAVRVESGPAPAAASGAKGDDAPMHKLAE
ncbi:MAG: efflux RND transporter periplasmic adaptor subunit, partial [Bryobacterales bacterium]|nr:efflux RND transporter periplasmic adaptor subunit [Bryobacterales bacterium]